MNAEVSHAVMFVSEVLKMDHARINVLCEAILSTVDASGREHLFARLAREVHLHTVAEEEVVYSLFAGDPHFELFIKESKDEHSELFLKIDEIRWMNFDSSIFENRLALLQASFMRHALEEERVLIPLLEQRQGAHDLVALTRLFQECKKLHENDVPQTYQHTA